VAWTPDSRKLAIVDKYAPDNPMSIFLLDPATGERKQLTFPPPKALGDSAPSFSPDGSSIAFIRTFSLAVTDIFIVPVAGGEPRRLTHDGRRIFGMVWDRTANRIIFSSSRAGSARLWRIAPNGGGLERIVNIGENASFVTVSPQGDRLAYTRSQIDTNVWRYAVPQSGGDPQPLRLFPSNRQETGPRYSPDGRRIAFSSNRSGSQEIWIADSEGASALPLTSFGGPATGSPNWSPDGRTIAFDSRPDGNPDIYLISAEGGAPRRFTSDPSAEVVPTFSNDGRWIYFASNRTGGFQLWKKPAGSGDAVQVTRDGGFRAVESADGKWLYFAKSPTGPGLWRMPVQGGLEEPVLESLSGGFFGYWELSSNGVYYLDRREVEGEGVKYSLRLLALNPRSDTLVMPMPRRPYNAGLSLSPDGKYLLYTQVDQSDTDIILVNHFR
jgi:Tol biopolymer transport system component